jgi:hypothetical protein
MTFDLDIGGATKLLKAGSLNIRETANRRCTVSFQLDSVDRSYRAPEGEDVTITADSVLIFGGLIDKPRERGMGGPRFPGISTEITAVDYQVYAERRFVNLTLAAGTLKSQLTTLVTTYLATYGVTLDAGQVNGPTMPELTYDYKRFDAVMNELMTLTAEAGQPFIWEIGYDKVFQCYQPSTDPAPFDLVGDDLPEVRGDVEVETARSDQYANRIILKVKPKQEIEREETFTEGVDAYPYVPQYTVLKHWGYVTHEGIYETLTTTPFIGSATWTFDMTSQELDRTAGAPGTGEVTVFKFDGEFSGVWTAEDAGEIAAVGVWERVIILESIPNDATGQQFADAELAKRSAPIITVKYKTWEQGLTIGQQQTITIPARDVTGSAVIVDISTRDLVHRLEHTVTAVIDATQTNLGRSFQDDYDIWFGEKGGGGGLTTVGAGAGASTGPGGPDLSVQYNNSGAFGGKASHTFYAPQNSVSIGDGSDITAAGFDSCFIAGQNCHITDP